MLKKNQKLRYVLQYAVCIIIFQKDGTLFFGYFYIEIAKMLRCDHEKIKLFVSGGRQSRKNMLTRRYER